MIAPGHVRALGRVDRSRFAAAVMRSGPVLGFHAVGLSGNGAPTSRPGSACGLKPKRVMHAI